MYHVLKNVVVTAKVDTIRWSFVYSLIERTSDIRNQVLLENWMWNKSKETQLNTMYEPRDAVVQWHEIDAIQYENGEDGDRERIYREAKFTISFDPFKDTHPAYQQDARDQVLYVKEMYNVPDALYQKIIHHLNGDDVFVLYLDIYEGDKFDVVCVKSK